MAAGAAVPALDEQSKEIREIMLNAIADAVPADCILLSGGLDTCILAEAAPLALARSGQAPSGEMSGDHASTQDGGVGGPPEVHNAFKMAITVLAGPHATDRPYAEAIAKQCNIPHIIIGGVDTIPAQVLDKEIDFVVRVLRTFDPMEIRNSIAVAAALREAHARGCTSALTGDAADELFGGYSFTHGMSEEKYVEYREHLINVMQFSAVPLGKALGIQVRQPYLDKRVIAFAQRMTKADVINVASGGSEEPRIHGKLVLRRAFPGVHSAWRRKDPIEVGCGTTVLPAYFRETTPESEFEAEKARVLADDRIKIRDPEHLHYYKAFCRVFQGKSPPGMVRWGSDPCIGCGYELSTKTQTFCITCGEYPARITPTPA